MAATETRHDQINKYLNIKKNHVKVMLQISEQELTF